MSHRARELASHLKVFNKRLLVFLDSLDEFQLMKKLPWEGYPILTVAAHISGSRHYGLVGTIQGLLQGEEMPNLTDEMMVDLANQDFEEHLDWDYDRVIENLRLVGDESRAVIAGLSESELSVVGYSETYGGEISVEQLIDWILIGTSVEHLENMKRIV